MISKEKILKLHFKLLSVPKSHEDAVISEWLEQNQPVKSQKFEVNWNDVPADEVTMRLIAHYYTKNGVPGKSVIISEEQRPKPTQVEVGQIWRKYQLDYEIYGLSTVTSLGEIVPAVDYVVKGIAEDSDDFVVSTRTLRSFLAQFERVS